MSDCLRKKIVEAAREQIGRPCKPRRVTPVSTVDCIGFVLGIARRFELDCPMAGHFRSADRRNPVPLLRKHFDQKSVADAEPGDLMLFRIGRSEHHFGIATERFGTLAFVHAYDKTRKVVEVSLDRTWRRRLAGCYAFRRAV